MHANLYVANGGCTLCPFNCHHHISSTEQSKSSDHPEVGSCNVMEAEQRQATFKEKMNSVCQVNSQCYSGGIYSILKDKRTGSRVLFGTSFLHIERHTRMHLVNFISHPSLLQFGRSYITLPSRWDSFSFLWIVWFSWTVWAGSAYSTNRW